MAYRTTDSGREVEARPSSNPESSQLPAHSGSDVHTEPCRDRRVDLAARLELCSFDELRVIDKLLGRLELGRSRYGYLDLSRDRRDFKREEAEEHLDAAVYRACDELDAEDREIERVDCDHCKEPTP